MPRNDPTDTGGLFIGRRPGTAPIRYRSRIGSAEEDGAGIAVRLAAQHVYVAPGRLWDDDRHVRAALRGPQAVDRLARALLAR